MATCNTSEDELVAFGSAASSSGTKKTTFKTNSMTMERLRAMAVVPMTKAIEYVCRQ